MCCDPNSVGACFGAPLRSVSGLRLGSRRVGRGMEGGETEARRCHTSLRYRHGAHRFMPPEIRCHTATPRKRVWYVSPLPVERFIKSFEIEILLQYYANSTQQRINLRCPCAAAYPSCRTQQCACKKEYVMHYYGSQYIEDISALPAPEHPIHRTLTKC